MKDFLRAIFSRGVSGATYDPVVSIGGVDNTSASLTYDVAHFSNGALVVTQVGGASGTATSIVSISGTPNVNVVQWGSSNVQSASFGVPTVGWFQRLDATNDAILAYGQARTNDIAPAVTNGSNTPIITDSLGKQVVLPGAVGDMTVRGSFQGAGVLAQTLITTPGAGRRIAVQFLGITVSGSEALNVILSGGPTNLTFGPFVPTGGISANAGGAPMYITSASTNLSVAGSTTASFGIVATGYQMSN